VEARYYFRANIAGIRETLVLCSLFSPADERLLRESKGALIVCEYRGEDDLIVIRVTAVLSVVTMAPFRTPVPGRPPRFFLVEKFSLGVVDSGVVLE
jgi:hypothetical protein